MQILVADDDFVSRSMICKMLARLGHEPLAAENGTIAWETIQADKVRMVITDWMMPGMDGPELCRTIRANQTWGYVFIFLVTAKGDKDSIVTGLESGADDYLTKPFNQAELTARLKTGLRILALEASLQQAGEAVRRLSLTDDLTGCYNQRYLHDQLAKELHRTERFGHALSVIFTDIDHFKRVNDTYGHPAGDQVLAEFAARLCGQVRQQVDWVVRYGGEEFLIVLPESTPAQATKAAERLRAAVADRPFAVADQSLPVTASFGVTGIPQSAEAGAASVDGLIARADALLYLAKQEGRNRVTSGNLNQT